MSLETAHKNINQKGHHLVYGHRKSVVYLNAAGES